MLEYAMERSLSLAQRRAASTSAEDMLVQEAIHESLHSEHDESARLALFHSELDAAISHSEIDASALERAISDSELEAALRASVDITATPHLPGTNALPRPQPRPYPPPPVLFKSARPDSTVHADDERPPAYPPPPSIAARGRNASAVRRLEIELGRAGGLTSATGSA